MQTRAIWNSGNMSFRDPDLSPSEGVSLWETCPILAIQQDPSIGHIYMEDFHRYNADEWTITQATTGTAALGTDTSGGTLVCDSNSTTSTQGVNVQHTAGPVIIPAAGKHIWAEFCVKVTDTIDKGEVFVGLAEADTTIIGTSALSTSNHIGWYSVTDDGVLLFGAAKAAAAATKAATTLVEDTYIKLGFYVNGVTSIQQYLDGVATSAAHATANVPIVKLIPSFVCQSAGTNDPILTVDWYKIVQLR
jgi:hypothetical protein